MRDPNAADENADYEVVAPWWFVACLIAVGVGIGIIVTALALA